MQMTKRRLLCCFCLLVWLGVAVAAKSQEPTRENLLAAWEASQREDPQTLVFEKLDDGRYRFATERFPFDGTVRVLNLVIDDRSLSYDAVGVMGIVEADFEDVDDEFRRQYAYSIGLWHTANTLYFDPDEARWMSASDWQRSMVEQYTGGGGYSALSGFAWLVLLAVLIILVLWLTLRAHRQLNRTNAAQDKVLAEQERVIRLSEQAIEISRDSNRVLKEIRDSLNSSDS